MVKRLRIKKPIRLAKIINPYSIAVNVGIADGARKGDLLGIVDTQGEKIIDPLNNSVLGYIKDYKYIVMIIETQEKFSIATLYTDPIPDERSLKQIDEKGAFNIGSPLKPLHMTTGNRIEIGDEIELLFDS